MRLSVQRLPGVCDITMTLAPLTFAWRIIHTDVVAEAVYFFRASVFSILLFRVISSAWQRSACTSGIHRATVIVSEINQYIITRFDGREYTVPKTFREISTAASSA